MVLYKEQSNNRGQKKQKPKKHKTGILGNLWEHVIRRYLKTGKEPASHLIPYAGCSNCKGAVPSTFF